MSHRASNATVITYVNRWPSNGKEPWMYSRTARGYCSTGDHYMELAGRRRDRVGFIMISIQCSLQWRHFGMLAKTATVDAARFSGIQSHVCLKLVVRASADARVTAHTNMCRGGCSNQRLDINISEPEIKFSVEPPAVRSVALRHVRAIDFPSTFSPSCVCMSEYRGRTNGGLSPDLLTLSLFVMLRVYCSVLTRMWLHLTLRFS